MKAFAKTLRNHWQEVANFYCCEVISGPLEGINDKIKTLKRQSYGFRYQEYFKLKNSSVIGQGTLLADEPNDNTAEPSKGNIAAFFVNSLPTPTA